jgi:hypothetical protein
MSGNLPILRGPFGRISVREIEIRCHKIEALLAYSQFLAYPGVGLWHGRKATAGRFLLACLLPPRPPTPSRDFQLRPLLKFLLAL